MTLVYCRFCGQVFNDEAYDWIEFTPYPSPCCNTNESDWCEEFTP